MKRPLQVTKRSALIGAAVRKARADWLTGMEGGGARKENSGRFERCRVLIGAR